MARPATLYVKTGCPACAAKRQELAVAGRSFTEVNVTDHPEVMPELLKLTGGRDVVPVLVDGTRIAVGPHGG